MKDCFWCKHLSHNKTFCSKFGNWRADREKCNSCENKKCEMCENKEEEIYQNGEWIPYCNICENKTL